MIARFGGKSDAQREMRERCESNPVRTSGLLPRENPLEAARGVGRGGWSEANGCTVGRT